MIYIIRIIVEFIIRIIRIAPQILTTNMGELRRRPPTGQGAAAVFV